MTTPCQLGEAQCAPCNASCVLLSSFPPPRLVSPHDIVRACHPSLSPQSSCAPPGSVRAGLLPCLAA